MSYPVFDKDPNAVLDYEVDWSEWLQESEVITSHSEITQGSIVVEDETSNTDTAVTIWVSGGTVGQQSAVTSRITTNQGRTDDRTFRLNIRER